MHTAMQMVVDFAATQAEKVFSNWSYFFSGLVEIVSRRAAVEPILDCRWIFQRRFMAYV